MPIALYRWLGVGDELLRSGDDPFATGAVRRLLGGDYQEFRLGFEFQMPLGLRRELAQVRNQQLGMARERARLEDMELEISHQLTDAVQDLDAQLLLVQTNFNRYTAAVEQVQAVEASFQVGGVPLDLLLDAQRRRADAEVAFYQSVINYNTAITRVHFRKGSIFDYNGVMLAEGPWPAKAYFDAQNRARQRDASFHLDYGFSRPRVASRGTRQQAGIPPATRENIDFGEDYPEVPEKYRTDAKQNDRDQEPTPAIPDDFGDFQDAERVPLGPPDIELDTPDDSTPFDLQLNGPSPGGEEIKEFMPDLEANRGPRTIQSTPRRKPSKRRVTSDSDRVFRASANRDLEVRWKD